MTTLKALIVLTMGAFLFWWIQKTPAPRLLTLEGATMGTSWNIQLNTMADDTTVTALGQELSVLLEHLDKEVFSTWETASELSQLNQAPLQLPVEVSTELLQVLVAAADIYEQSGGVFDITVGPLVDLWGFGPAETRALPSADDVEWARSRLGLHNLVLQPELGTASKLADIQLDLSGIAKGYAVDRVAEYLFAHGQRDFLVEIGGELRVQGVRPDGKSWRVAIEKPQSGTREAYALIDTQGRSMALAGSGDYRNFRIENGKRFSHEIDPRSGYPIEHQLAAVTVLTDSAMIADAWATALMVLGPEAGRQMADRLQLHAYFIIREDSGFSVSATEGMSQLMVTTRGVDAKEAMNVRP